MVLRLVIHDRVHNNGHSCLTNAVASHSFEKIKNHLILSWIKHTVASSVKRATRKEKRSPILAAVGIAVGVSALFNLFSGLMNSNEIFDIKSKKWVGFNHMQTLDDAVSYNCYDIVEIATSAGSLYKYAHESFRNFSEKLKNFECRLENELTKFLTQCNAIEWWISCMLIKSV